MQHLPVYYHRSTIISVDDDILVSNALRSLLSKDYEVKSFSESKLFLDFVNNNSFKTPNYITPYECKDHEYSDTATHLLIDFNIPGLHHLLNDPTRIDDISVIIVDYNMPNINGLELCKLLEKHPAKKILLTGEADNETAVNAFNNNLIDRFIRKDSRSLVEDILRCVDSLTYEYYRAKTLPIYNHLEAKALSPLSDPLFATFFNTWVHKNSIKEYTLIDKNGSFKLRNHHGEYSFLIIHTDHSLDTYIQLDTDDQDEATFRNTIMEREFIPFFGVGSDYWKIEPYNWGSYLHKANLHRGRENYYWAHVFSEHTV